MEKKSEEGESEPEVYEIRGEPAVVINGVPKIDPNCSSLVPSNSIKEDGEPRKEKGCGEWLEGREVQKLFGGKYYHGKVIQFDKETGWYTVEYEDGDSEDLDWVELEEVLLPVDIGVPLKTVALKVMNNKQKDGQQPVLPESEIHKDKLVGKKGKKTRAR
ncbi:Dirigent protein 17 [Hibiscus syriacus]|uniref:Dirigent protein 17 n=1 Tax=Hibiscus syriacus TaxID=106335 RepID=A0A6A2ZLV8_HIBSY|nr:dirigent protein 17-like [Hibiscus syriacus]KAE8692467.1 Dirigent protein 17 [Hibiscus syriacus]